METTQIITFHRILATTGQRQASDLHLTVGKRPIIRIAGRLISLDEEEVLTADWLRELANNLLSKAKQEILKKEKDITFIYNLENQARFKINIFYQKSYIAINCHLISSRIKSLIELGLPSEVKKFVQLKNGLIIIAGPFGSGRTTTTISLLEEINKSRAEHIVTIEEPIEFLFNNKKSIIDQREVGRDTNSFLDALENCQHEDIDVLMISEIGGTEEIAAILDLANAGTLVLAIMDTDSVMQTVEKILFSFQSFERERIQNLLANVLEGIIVQRLLPKVGGGMSLAVELLISTLAVKSIIREGKIGQLNNVLQTSREEGMTTLDRSLAELVKQGKIEKSEALAQSIDKDDFKSSIRA